MTDDLRSSATAAIESRQLHVARPLWQQLCERDPLDTDNWLVLSAIDEQLGFLPAALDHLKYARHLSPDDPDVWLQSAKIKWRLRDLDGAFADLANALSLDFADHDTRSLLASWLMECHRFAEAVVHYRFLHLDGGDLDATRSVKALACALCAGHADLFDQWRRRHAREHGDGLDTAIAGELEYLLLPAELDRLATAGRAMAEESAELATNVRERLECAHAGYDWRKYFDRRAHVADYAGSEDSTLPLQTLAGEIRRSVTPRGDALPHVLDLGCGTGRLADELAGHELDLVLTGVDRSSECIRVANGKNRYDNLVVADIARDVPGDLIAAADCVVLADVLDYCDDAPSVVSSVMAAMPDRATLYVTWERSEVSPVDLEDCVRRAARERKRHCARLDVPGRGAAVVRGEPRGPCAAAGSIDPCRDSEAVANGLIQATQMLGGGRYEECGRKSGEVLEAFPASSQALFHLGVYAQHRQEFDEALHYFHRALLIHEGFASAWFHIGAVHQQRRPAGRVIGYAYNKCLKYSPDHLAAVTNFVQHCVARGEEDAAWRALQYLFSRHPLEVAHLETIKTSLEQQPGSRLLQRLQDYLAGPEWLAAQLGQAMTRKYLQRAGGLIEQLRETGFDAEQLLFQRAQLAEKSGEPRLATKHAFELLREQPDNPAYWQFLASVTAARGRLKSAFRVWRFAAARAKPDNPMLQNRLFFSNYCEDLSAGRISGLHLEWGRELSMSVEHRPPPDLRVRSHDKLRIGYVSGDFRMHSVSIFLYNILKYRNRDDFEVYCYSTTPGEDPMTTKLRLFSDRWREIGQLDDDAACRLIERDEIDILVDLAGHTASNRLPLFCRRPAPVQCTYLGYANTTGLAEIDYRITDCHADPPGMTEDLHSEELLRLHNGFLSYSRHLSSTPVTFEGRRDPVRHYTFVCCNNVYKVNDRVIETWSRILRRLPEARLLIKAHNLNNPEIIAAYRSRFEKCGVDPGRVHLMNTIDVNEHQNLYNHADIALDPFPYNGTTTTCDALWMGVPVLVLAGDRHAGRVGVSILSRIGLTEWIAADEEDYVDKAVRFARDPGYLRSLRLTMRQRLRSSPLMKPGLVTADLEDAYRRIWRRHRDERARRSGGGDRSGRPIAG